MASTLPSEKQESSHCVSSCIVRGRQKLCEIQNENENSSPSVSGFPLALRQGSFGSYGPRTDVCEQRQGGVFEYKHRITPWGSKAMILAVGLSVPWISGFSVPLLFQKSVTGVGIKPLNV